MCDRFGTNLFLTLALLCILTLCAGADSIRAAEGIASFKTVSGTVDVLRGGKLPAVVVKAGDSLSEGDFVRTRSGSFTEIQFKDGTVLKVAQRSRIDIAAYFSGQQKNGANVRLPRGKVEAIVDPARVKEAGKGRRFEVHTPNAVAGVRGTDFIVSHERNLTGVFVRHGSVYTYNRLMPERMVTVNAGNITTITPGAPPQTPRQALPSETQRMEKGMSAPKGTNGGGQSGAQNGSQTGQTGSQSTSQTGSQSTGQSDSQTGSQTTGTGTITTGTQTTQAVASSSSGATMVSEPLPVITTFAAPTTSDITMTKTTTVIAANPTAGSGPILTAAPTTTLPPPTPPPAVSPLSTNTNVNVIVNIPPIPPPIVPPPSTNVNINVNF